MSLAPLFTVESVQISGSQLEALSPPRPAARGCLAMFRDMFSCRDWDRRKCATGVEWVEARNATEHPTVHRTVPQNKELSGPKCQPCQGWETALACVMRRNIHGAFISHCPTLFLCVLVLVRRCLATLTFLHFCFQYLC